MSQAKYRHLGTFGTVFAVLAGGLGVVDVSGSQMVQFRESRATMPISRYGVSVSNGVLMPTSLRLVSGHLAKDKIMACMSLPLLKTGDSGVIDHVGIARGGAKRLADLGFVRGARVEMVRTGAPCIVRVDGTCVGLGQAHQASIHLNPA